MRSNGAESILSKITSKEAVEFAVVSRVLVLLLAAVSSVIADSVPNVLETGVPLLDPFYRWDTGYYVGIAAYGYSGAMVSRWAFRPLFPLLLRLVGFPLAKSYGAIPSYLTAGLIWNFLAFVVGIFFLYKLTDLLLDKEHAFYTAVLMCVVPGSVFFTAVYPEATYLLMITTSFYFLESDRIFRASIFATLAGFTRPEGFLAFIPFAWKAIVHKGPKRFEALLGSAMTAYTLPAFMLLGRIEAGDYFISFRVESTWPKATLLDMLIGGVVEPFDKMMIYTIATLLLVVAVLSIAGYFWVLHEKGRLPFTLRPELHDRRMPYYIWAGILLGAFLYEGGYGGLPRFIAPLFPILWSNVAWARKSLVRVFILAASYTCIMALGVVLFVNGYFFL